MALPGVRRVTEYVMAWGKSRRRFPVSRGVYCTAFVFASAACLLWLTWTRSEQQGTAQGNTLFPLGDVISQKEPLTELSSPDVRNIQPEQESFAVPPQAGGRSPDFAKSLPADKSETATSAAGARSLRLHPKKTRKQKAAVRKQLSVEDYDTADMLYSLLNGTAPFDAGHNVPDYRQVFRYTSAQMPAAPTEPLTVFIIPHSHNDPGWLETFETYYQQTSADILDTVLWGLQTQPEWKFIWSEMSFLHRWWRDQSASTRQQFSSLVRSGRLELTTGGWVMPDEANAHYYAILDQLMEGHDWIRANVDAQWQPLSSWSNDPFGYSSSVAHLYQQAGVRRMMILRVHYMLKWQLASRRALQFRWRQPWDTHGDSAIFTHMEPSGLYSTKHSCGPSEADCCNFDFFYLDFCVGGADCDCSVDKITARNVRRKAQILLEQARSKSKLFRVNTVAVLNGDDFRYNTRVEATAQYQNFKLLMDYINSHPELNAKVKFGTLSEFLAAVDTSSSPAQAPPLLHGNFFPYSDTGRAYWTGYFTSRPHHKRVARVVQSFLFTADALLTLMHARKFAVANGFRNLTLARRDFNLFQHHDAVTGTSRTYVMEDYLERLEFSLGNLTTLCSESLSLLAGVPQLRSVVTAQIDTNALGVAEHTVDVLKGPLSVVVFNPLPRQETRLVTLNVNSPSISLSSCAGDVVPVQVQSRSIDDVPVSARDRRQTGASHRVWFEAALPPLGFSTFTVGVEKSAKPAGRVAREVVYGQMSGLATKRRKPFILRVAQFSAHFSADGLLTQVRIGTQQIDLRIQFVVYQEGDIDGQTGGAYIFQPESTAIPMSGGSQCVHVMEGPLCQSVTSYWSFFNHTVRICTSHATTSDTDSSTKQPEIRLSVENSVNLLQLEPNVDFAMRLTSPIRSDDVFFTDLNSLQMARRRRFLAAGIASNFYPMTSLAYIEDSRWRLLLHTAQPLGVTSLQSGSLEVVLDRYTVGDDGRGPVGGTPDCYAHTRSTFEVVLERQSASAGLPQDQGELSLSSQRLSEMMLHPPQVYVSARKRSAGRACRQGLLRSSLPCDVQLVALRRLEAPSNPAGPRSALVLHRVPVAHGTRRPVPSCAKLTAAAGSLSFSSLFTDLAVQSVVNSSLTCLTQHGSINPLSPIQLSSRELRSFLISLGSVQQNL